MSNSYFPPPRPQVEDRLAAGDAALDAAMSVFSTEHLERRFTLAVTGERMRFIYRVRSGILARLMELPDGREQIFMLRLPGDLVGLRCMIMERQLDTIRVLAPVLLQRLASTQALALASDNSDTAVRFMWQFAEDERRLHKWVIALGRGSAAARIAALVLDVRGRLLHAGLIGYHASFHLPLTQQQIADHLGTTLVHVNRTLRQLRGQNILHLQRGRVKVLDLAALSELARPIQDIYERASAAFSATPDHC
jgi:CRP/FNR family transcriptional regulator, anaerobic regulatory protein